MTLPFGSMPSAGLLQDVGDDERDAWAARLRWQRFAKREVVVKEGARDRVVRMVGAGTLRVTSYSASGREVVFRNLKPGDVFGDYGAIDSQPRSAHVIAVTDAWIGVMEAEPFIEAVLGDRRLALAEMRSLTAMIRLLSTRLVELSTLKANYRIHAELLRVAAEHRRNGNSVVIEPAPGQRELAARAGTQREVVSRELGRLEKLGLIHREGDTLVVRDLKALSTLAAHGEEALE